MKAIKTRKGAGSQVQTVRRELRREIDDALARHPSVPRRTLVSAMAVAPHDTAEDIADHIEHMVCAMAKAQREARTIRGRIKAFAHKVWRFIGGS